VGDKFFHSAAEETSRLSRNPSYFRIHKRNYPELDELCASKLALLL